MPGSVVCRFAIQIAPLGSVVTPRNASFDPTKGERPEIHHAVATRPLPFSSSRRQSGESSGSHDAK